MKHLHNQKVRFLLIVCLLFGILTMPVMGQDEPEPSPTMEVMEVIAEQPEVSGDTGATFFDWMQFAIENELHWYIFAIIGLMVAGNLVPQNVIAERKEAARRTETPIDDVLVAILEGIQSLKNQTSPIPLPVPEPIPDEPKPTPPFIPAPDVGKMPKGIPLVYFGYKSHASGRPFYEKTNVGKDDRRVAVSPGFDYWGEPAKIDGVESPHCDVFYRDGGFEFALANKAGRFGYEFPLNDFVLAGRSRYAIVVLYSHSFNPRIGSDGNPTLYLGGILTSGGLVRVMEDQPVTVESKEAQWVLETSQDYYDMRVKVGVHMPWTVIAANSTLKIDDIQFVPVADDYGNDHPEKIIRM